MSKKNPALVINLQKIEHNARIITTLCRRHGISVAGVTKGFCAIAEVAEVMLRGGCSMLADSRLINLRRLRQKHFDVEYLLLRLPRISEAENVVELADISLNSEVKTIKALNDAAKKAHKRHKIILMIDVGDLREGIWPDTLKETVDEILIYDHILLEGIGCNLACYSGVIPTPENMKLLLQQKDFIETTYTLKLNLVSGGNTANLKLLASGKMPPGINHLRIGEGIILGRNTNDRSTLPNTYQDTFILRAEIIECKSKPSVPIGITGQDAYGNIPQFEDKGNRLRVILAIGRQDIRVDGLQLVDSKGEILGASSDHLIVDITDADREYAVGDIMEFYPDYGALVAASTSEYVAKEFI